MDEHEPGDLVQQGDRWVIVEPEACPNGHRFGLSGGALVSFAKCAAAVAITSGGARPAGQRRTGLRYAPTARS